MEGFSLVGREGLVEANILGVVSGVQIGVVAGVESGIVSLVVVVGVAGEDVVVVSLGGHDFGGSEVLASGEAFEGLVVFSLVVSRVVLFETVLDVVAQISGGLASLL